MVKKGATSGCSTGDARGHLARAKGYLDLAEVAQADRTGEQARVSVGNAVLAGIAASDAICCARSGERSSPPNHQDAVRLLQQVTGDRQLGAALRELIELKGKAHYGLGRVSHGMNVAAVRRARELVAAAQDAVA
jgi:hypothetical protein